MTEAAIQARRAYKREWNAKNKDRLRKYQETYWNRKAEAAKADKPTEDTVTE